MSAAPGSYILHSLDSQIVAARMKLRTFLLRIILQCFNVLQGL